MVGPIDRKAMIGSMFCEQLKVTHKLLRKEEAKLITQDLSVGRRLSLLQSVHTAIMCIERVLYGKYAE